jgi:hypothetical protein
MSLDGPLSPLASITCLNRTCEALYVNVVKKWPCAPLIPAAVLREEVFPPVYWLPDCGTPLAVRLQHAAFTSRRARDRAIL